MEGSHLVQLGKPHRRRGRWLPCDTRLFWVVACLLVSPLSALEQLPISWGQVEFAPPQEGFLAKLAPSFDSTCCCPTRPTATDCWDYLAHPTAQAAWELAEMAYSRGVGQEHAGSQDCVDSYYLAASYAWEHLSRATAGGELFGRSWQLHHSATAKVISLGQVYGRLKPSQGLLVNTYAGSQWVPIRFRGFVWRPDDFQHLMVVGDYPTDKLNRVYIRRGLGVPLVAVRIKRASRDPLEAFLASNLPFAATAVLRPQLPGMAPGPLAPSSAPTVPPGEDSHARLDVYDPTRIDYVDHSGRRLVLAADFSAVWSYATDRSTWSPLSGFILPDPQTEAHLVVQEPPLKGKIPIIFVHGLLSDPLTYVAMANELEQDAEFRRRFQVWAFRYPTGGGILEVAAEFRSQLQQLTALADPTGTDPAYQQIVLVGHSMGGLVSKLLVTASGHQFWNRVASRPLETIRSTEETRTLLRAALFFQPVPNIRRVIFIAVPHDGSPWADRGIGELSSALVETTSSMELAREQLLRDNPGVFSPIVANGLPSSIDLLSQGNPFLRELQQLRVSPHVHLHAIIGIGRTMLNGGPADGVVPLASAQHPAVESEILVNARHSTILQHEQTIAEVRRILDEHWAVHTATVPGTAQ